MPHHGADLTDNRRDRPKVLSATRWRDRAVSLPAGIVDGEVDAQCDRAERRYRRFFAAVAGVLASLAERLR